LPFGITLIAPAMSEHSLTATAQLFLEEPAPAALPPGFTEVAVLGAHLTGMPLNHQLTSRGGYLRETTRTSPEYRFYALANSTPPKPGLEYVPGLAGPGIEVEIWAIPKTEFGSFVAEIPPPLGIGTANLMDGRKAKCFIAEPYALASATDITKFGGWRAYMASR
jgi:allophanate hydrolase